MRLHHDIQLQPKGKLVRMEWDVENEKFVERELLNDEICFYLYNSICFANNVTLKDLMMLIARDRELFTIITSCDCLDELLDELKKPGKIEHELFALEIAWSVDIIESGAFNVLSDRVEFYGCGKERMALEFMPSGNIANIPLLLNEAFNVYDFSDNLVLPSTKHFTLLDVVCGVVGELTSLGSPSDRDEILSDLNERELEEENSKSIDEVMENLDKKVKEGKEKFPCIICGSDSRCTCFGKPMNLCHDCFKKMEQT